MRRVVKFAISPDVMAFLIGVCIAINTVLCLLIPYNITPTMETLWGSFLHMWLLISIGQMISHSVYLCTPVSIFGSGVHMTVLITSAVLVPRSLFSKWLWLVPSLCTVFVSYQFYLVCVVYTHVHARWMYALGGVLLVLLPMTQLTQIDINSEDTMVTSCMWSCISIFTLYMFAIANSRGAVLVDVTIGASPTWQLQD